jgi:hypothetical protein
MAIPRWEILLGQVVGLLVGLALIAAGVGLWVKNPGPTVSTVTVTTVTGTHHTHDVTVTTILNGQQSQLAVAKSPDAVPQRSEVVTVGLVVSGVLLIIGTSWLPRLRSLVVVAKPDEPEEDDGGDDEEE